MLKVFYGDLEDDKYIFDPDTFFNNTYQDEWIVDDLSKQMIFDVDKSRVIGHHLIESPVLGPISQKELSGGVKTLILINNDDKHIFNASACGDNCAKWLLEIGKNKDVTIRLGYFMDFGEEPFEITILNTGKVVNTQIELNQEVIEKDLL